jgi:hypothetical protein
VVLPFAHNPAVGVAKDGTIVVYHIGADNAPPVGRKGISMRNALLPEVDTGLVRWGFLNQHALLQHCCIHPQMGVACKPGRNSLPVSVLPVGPGRFAASLAIVSRGGPTTADLHGLC